MDSRKLSFCVRYNLELCVFNYARSLETIFAYSAAALHLNPGYSVFIIPAYMLFAGDMKMNMIKIPMFESNTIISSYTVNF